MIMGAGKTTVVCPLLSLILADGSSLITLAVPPALLSQSRDVLRRRFSSVVHKRIYTYNFDRYDPRHRLVSGQICFRTDLLTG